MSNANLPSLPTRDELLQLSLRGMFCYALRNVLRARKITNGQIINDQINDEIICNIDSRIRIVRGFITNSNIDHLGTPSDYVNIGDKITHNIYNAAEAVYQYQIAHYAISDNAEKIIGYTFATVDYAINAYLVALTGDKNSNHYVSTPVQRNFYCRARADYDTLICLPGHQAREIGDSMDSGEHNDFREILGPLCSDSPNS
jgi:hypothetical protein